MDTNAVYEVCEAQLEGFADTLEKLGFVDVVKVAYDKESKLVKVEVIYSEEHRAVYVFEITYAVYFLAGITTGLGVGIGRK